MDFFLHLSKYTVFDGMDHEIMIYCGQSRRGRKQTCLSNVVCQAIIFPFFAMLNLWKNLIFSIDFQNISPVKLMYKLNCVLLWQFIINNTDAVSDYLIYSAIVQHCWL